MPEPSDIDRQIEVLIREKDWRGILERLESGAASPDQIFLVAGARVSLLPIAIERGWTELAVSLIQQGTPIDARGRGIAPIIDACEFQNHSVIEALIAAGANPNVKAPKSDGEPDDTPLMVAAEKLDLWAVQRLLQAGADPATLNCRKQSAIHHALMFYAVKPQPNPVAMEIVRELLEAGCPLGGTELHFALDRRDVAMTRLLLEQGCPVNVPFPHNEEGGPKKGDTPLTTLIRMNGVDLVGGTLGFEPTEERRWELTRMLLAAGADPNLPGARGWTPLRLALPAVVGHPDLRIAELLVAAGADPDYMPPNVRAETPRAVATKLGLSDILELFQSANEDRP